MKVLIVCHRLPYPPKRGGKIRPFNIIKSFSQSGNDVTVASLVRSRLEAEEGAGLSEHCNKLLVGSVNSVGNSMRMVARLATLEPSSFSYFFSRDLRHKIRRELAHQQYDLIIAHCSSVAPYVAGLTGTPKVLDFGDMDSEKWFLYSRHRPFPLSAGYWLEAKKLSRTEANLANRFDLCTCTTRAELATLRSHKLNTRTDWFPNGVDADFFSPGSGAFEANTICFVGRMDYFPNQQAVTNFCNEVLPVLQTHLPLTRFLVVGAEPPRRIRELGRRKGVTITGTVPDVRPYVRSAALTVAPLLIARGTQNKILESMAMEVPVVASKEAAKGVDARPGEHLLTARSNEEFARAIMSILKDPTERRRLAHAGRHRVISHHSWSAAMQRLHELVAEFVENCKGRRSRYDRYGE